MNNLTISSLKQRDIPEAARVLSLAMVSCPVHVAVFQGQGDDVRRVQEWMFARLLRDSPGLVFVGKLDGQVVAVLRTKSCRGGQATNAEVDESTLQDTTSRVSYWQNVWDCRDPKEPHWHLGPVGVVPPCQGSGIGTVLMQRFCHEVDAHKAAAFLETDQPRSVRFYGRFGFQVVDEVDIFGVTNYFMWRPPTERGVETPR